MVNNSFIEKYRNSAGYVLPPILNNGNSTRARIEVNPEAVRMS